MSNSFFIVERSAVHEGTGTPFLIFLSSYLNLLNL